MYRATEIQRELQGKPAYLGTEGGRGLAGNTSFRFLEGGRDAPRGQRQAAPGSAGHARSSQVEPSCCRAAAMPRHDWLSGRCWWPLWPSAMHACLSARPPQQRVCESPRCRNGGAHAGSRPGLGCQAVSSLSTQPSRRPRFPHSARWLSLRAGGGMHHGSWISGRGFMDKKLVGV